jgi:type II secretory pathway pseudopilin PulG
MEKRRSDSLKRNRPPTRIVLRGHLRRLSSERGATIVEMLIALVLAAMAAGLIATAISQFFLVTNDSNNRLAVLNDLQNAALWIGRDANEAQGFTPGSGSIYGTLQSGNLTVQYRYSYDSGSTALVRERLVDGGVESTTKIARRIADQADVVFALNGNLLSVSITASHGAISESTTIQVAMRVH